MSLCLKHGNNVCVISEFFFFYIKNGCPLGRLTETETVGENTSNSSVKKVDEDILENEHVWCQPSTSVTVKLLYLVCEAE